MNSTQAPAKKKKSAAPASEASVDAAKKKRGGARPGAGRKKNSGMFGEATEPLRIPASIAPQLRAYLDEIKEESIKAKAAGSAPQPVSLPSLAELFGAKGENEFLTTLCPKGVENAVAMKSNWKIPQIGLECEDCLFVERIESREELPTGRSWVIFDAEGRQVVMLAEKGSKGVEFKNIDGSSISEKSLAKRKIFGRVRSFARSLG